MRKQMNRKQKIKNKILFRYLTVRILILMVGLGALFYVNTYYAQIIRITGTSMEPTLKAGSRKIVIKNAYTTNHVERFDVIVFNDGVEESYKYIKRVIALPGETIQIHSGSIFINGEYLNDAYDTGSLEGYSAKYEILLGDDEYFVLGDNREESIDSRDFSFGNVNREQIIGRIKID